MIKKELPPEILKYLKKYATPSTNLNFKGPDGNKIIVVIPAIQEYSNIKSLLDSLIQNDSTLFDKTLILFVVNNLSSAEEEIKNNNKKTLQFLDRILINKPISGFEKRIINSGIKLSFIDCSSAGNELDEKHGGVGLARKIGMDTALTLFDYNTKGKNLIACLDADCRVDSNYLTQIYSTFSTNKLSAAYVNFEHILPANTQEKLAIINYEIFLRYYILGLKYAKSPYAFHTIGSTMICDAGSYIKIGGMNKKKAAEDFYFMQKLAKLAEIGRIDGTAVYPSARGSWRVPFGTGQRIARFLDHTQNEYLLYSPESFEILLKWLKIYDAETEFNPETIMAKAKEISNSLFDFLTNNNFTNDWNKILRNTKSTLQLQKQKKIWFDGFKTLKLIHYLRDNYCASIDMFEAVEELFKKMSIPPIKWHRNNKEIPELEIQLKFLQRLRNLA